MAKPKTACSGTWLVIAMLGFGVILASGLAIYLRMHTAPFQNLTAALDERFPGSAPRVDGGKRRLDQPGERVLRIVMKAPFDPVEDKSAKEFAREVQAFVAARQELSDFDVVEVHLFQERPERELSQRTIRLEVEVSVTGVDNEL